METAIKVVENMNGRFFVGRKMEVSVAEFGWLERVRRVEGGGFVRRVVEGPRANKVSLPKGEKNRHNTTNTGTSKRIQGCTYAEVVKGVAGGDEDCITIPREVILSNAGWLSNRLVGSVRCNEVIPSHPGIYEMGGIRGVMLARLGGNKVLVSFPKLDDVASALTEAHSVWNKAFASLQKWVPGLNANMRDVWIQCLGVPLHGWAEEVFMAIGGNFGEAVKIAKETLDKSNMEFGRLCVKTDLIGFINREVKIKIFGSLFKVLVKEELGLESRGFGPSMLSTVEPTRITDNTIGDKMLLSPTSSRGHVRLDSGVRRRRYCREDDFVPEVKSTAIIPATVDDTEKKDRSGHHQSTIFWEQKKTSRHLFIKIEGF